MLRSIQPIGLHTNMNSSFVITTCMEACKIDKIFNKLECNGMGVSDDVFQIKMRECTSLLRRLTADAG